MRLWDKIKFIASNNKIMIRIGKYTCNICCSIHIQSISSISTTNSKSITKIAITAIISIKFISAISNLELIICSYNSASKISTAGKASILIYS